MKQEKINEEFKQWHGILNNATNCLNKIKVIPTGSIQLDQALGIGGFPIGRIVEIYGNESSGKTTIALQLIKEAQQQALKALFIDAEHALDIEYVKSIGIDTNKLLVANPITGEQVFELIEYTIKNKLANLIVIDSVASMLPSQEAENNINDQQLGAHARLMSRGLRKIQALLVNENVCIVFLNQIREKIGVFFGNPETTTGGKALKFYTSIRIESKKADLIKNNNEKIGIKSKLTITKNKLAPPYKTAYVDIFFNQGYDYTNEIIEYAIENNIIQKNGSWYFYEDKKIVQGREQLRKYMLENLETFNKIKTIVINKLKINCN